MMTSSNPPKEFKKNSNEKKNEELLPSLTYKNYTIAMAFHIIEEMRIKKVTKAIKPYREQALNIFSDRIEPLFKKKCNEANLSETLKQELFWLMEMNSIAVSFSQLNTILVSTGARTNILDKADKLENHINSFYYEYPTKMLEDTDNFFRDTLMKLHYETQYLKMFDTLHAELEQIANTFKTSKHSVLLTHLIEEGYAIKRSMNAKTVYEKLITLTNAYKDLIQEDYNKRSLFSYSNNSLWHNGLSLVQRLETAIQNASSLKPLTQIFHHEASENKPRLHEDKARMKNTP